MFSTKLFAALATLVAAAASVGASARLVLLAVERDAAVPAAASTDGKTDFIDELQRR